MTNVITEKFFVDEDRNLKISEESEMKTINITANINYIDLDGHIKGKCLNNEKVIEKQLLETINTGDNKEEKQMHKIYLLEQGLYPISEFKDIQASDEEIKKYDNKIVEILNERIIQRCQDLEIKPLFGNENMKMFYVEKLKMILDRSGSMTCLDKIREEMKKLYNESNMMEYTIQDEKLMPNSDIFKAIQRASEEGCQGESIYFVSDYAIKGTNPDQLIASNNLIELLKKKNQRLYLHSVNCEPTQEFINITVQTGGWSATQKLEDFNF